MGYNIKGLLTFLEENSGTSVDEDTLLHGETLLVISAGDAEDVALVLFSHNFAVNFLAHSPVEERSAIYIQSRHNSR